MKQKSSKGHLAYPLPVSCALFLIVFIISSALPSILPSSSTAQASSASSHEKITSFDSSIYIDVSGTIVVTERIRALCLGNEIRHGIYRDIPTLYKSRLGFIDSHFKLLSVAMDGHDTEWHMKKTGNGNVRIYIGSAQRMVSRGEHTFEISYQMERMIGFFDEYDELYWNVTGNGWNFPIEKARVEIILPAKAEFVQYALYTGPEGSQASQARVVQEGDGVLVAETTTVLPPGHGFTIAAAWPKGLVRQPDRAEAIYAFLQDNRAFVAGVAGFLIVISYYLLAWSRVGKDPEPGNIIPLFAPPEGIGPAAARYIRNLGYDNRVMSSALVSMAVKGAIKIADKDGGYEIIKNFQGPRAPGLTRAEGVLFGALFSGGSRLRLSSEEASRIKKAIDRLKKGLRQECEKIYFLTNRRHILPGAAVTIITLVLMVLLSPNMGDSFFMTLWLSIWSVFSLILIASFVSIFREVIKRPSLKMVGATFFMAVFAIAFGAGLVVGSYTYGQMLGYNALVIFFALIISNLAFYHLMKAPTLKGRKIMDALEGFRLYLKTAEEKRLGILTPPERTPELFERYLPWAIALGVENEWSEKFKEVLERATASGTYTPAWYSGHGHFTPTSVSAIGPGMTTALSSASISGSGGGGASGGGGGGGGGGGW